MKVVNVLRSNIEARLRDVAKVRDALRDTVEMAEETLNNLDDTVDCLDAAKRAIDDLERSLDKVSELI